MLDAEALADDVFDAVERYLDERLAPVLMENAGLKARCKALEEAAAKPVEIDLTPVEKLIEAEIAKIPAPEPAKGLDREEVASMVDEAVAALPPPQDGKSVEIEQVLPAIAAEVAKAFEAYPVPKDGEPGRDGRGIKDLLVNREGHLIATMDDGTTKDLGHIIGKDGKDGQDGAPGFGLDDFDIEPASDGRTFTLKFTRGEVCHSYDLTFPVNIDAGVWKEAEDYVPGDGVTWGGQYYYCQQETKGEKPDQSKDGKPWRLAIRKGRDGKDAKNG